MNHMIQRLVVGGLVLSALAVLLLHPRGAAPTAAEPSTPALAQAFPLSARIDYQKATPLVTVKGNTLPGAVVQTRGASMVVGGTGNYSLRTSFPLSLVAVRRGLIRRLRFDLPEKAKKYVAVLAVGTDLKRVWASISGSLTITEHGPASILVRHVEGGTNHKGTLAKGAFLVSVPLVQGTNTIQWWLQIGVIKWQGPDLVVFVQ